MSHYSKYYAIWNQSIQGGVTGLFTKNDAITVIVDCNKWEVTFLLNDRKESMCQ